MSDLGPGDWVECVDISAPPGSSWVYPEERLIVGAVYLVSDVWVDDEGDAVMAVSGKERVRGSADWGFRVGYSVHRFRPIYRPKQELIESLKAPPVQTPEVVSA